MTLPELHEADAPPEVATIYAGLREAMGDDFARGHKEVREISD